MPPERGIGSRIPQGRHLPIERRHVVAVRRIQAPAIGVARIREIRREARHDLRRSFRRLEIGSVDLLDLSQQLGEMAGGAGLRRGASIRHIVRLQRLTCRDDWIAGLEFCEAQIGVEFRVRQLVVAFRGVRG